MHYTGQVVLKLLEPDVGAVELLLSELVQVDGVLAEGLPGLVDLDADLVGYLSDPLHLGPGLTDNGHPLLFASQFWSAQS